MLIRCDYCGDVESADLTYTECERCQTTDAKARRQEVERAAQIRAIVAWQWGRLFQIASTRGTREWNFAAEDNTFFWGEEQCEEWLWPHEKQSAVDFVDEIMGAK